MTRIGRMLVGTMLAAAAAGAQQPAGPDRSWAFPGDQRICSGRRAGPKSVPGSTQELHAARRSTISRTRPTGFPTNTRRAPPLVQKGHGAALACGACHLMSGEGHPESAGLTGFTAAYLVQQMADFKSGARKDSARMNAIAKDVSDEESRQVADWFAALKPRAWTKVTEAAMVPKTFVGQGRMRFVQPGGAMEPIGNRIITVPEDQARARSRDPHSGFVAYVPPGSIAKGKALVETGGGGRTIACAICHGDTLQGLGNVPRLAGLHPIYIARQLYLFKDGTRNGVDAQLMKKPVARLTDDDILAIAAYLGSLAP